MKSPIQQREIRSTRDIARELGATLELLERRHLEKVVIMKGTEVVGVMVSPLEYDHLKGEVPRGQDEGGGPAPIFSSPMRPGGRGA
jgi:hypothetical protein